MVSTVLLFTYLHLEFIYYGCYIPEPALECRCSCINSESLWYWSSLFNLCASDMLVDGNFIEVDEYITCLKFSQCFPDINLTFEIVSHKKYHFGISFQ